MRPAPGARYGTQLRNFPCIHLFTLQDRAGPRPLAKICAMTRRQDITDDSRTGEPPRGADIIPFRRPAAPEAPPAPEPPEHPDDDGPSAA